jgi:uncharacterized RDD family membrane protein YckC
MNQWYYVLDGQSVGPVAKSELMSRLESGALPAETLVWTADLKAWIPASEVDELQPWTPNMSSVPSAHGETLNSEPDDYEPSGSQVRPWVRYGARTVDLLIFCFVGGIILSLMVPIIFKIPEILFGVLLLAVYVLVEATMLAAWGTTPGKSLFRVRLRKRDGSKFTYREALTRSAKVWIRGEACGLPVVTLVTHITAYNRLLKSGSTSWDEEGNCIVTHQVIGTRRAILIASIFVVFVALMASGSAA